MNVLSLFDGISCARVALDRAGIEVNAYMASEIDKNAIKISDKNYPDIIRVGSVVGLEVEGQIDLLIGGSPCQDLSIAKKDRKGLEGDRSGLFWEYLRIKKECNPQWFVLENVASMPKADRDIITREMGVEPVMFNASLVSAQSRKRLFWTNIPFDLPVDRGILLKDILEADVEDKFYVKKEMKTNGKTTGKVGYVGDGEQYGQGGQAHRVYSTDGKTPTLSSGPALIKVGHIGNSDAQANRVYDTDGKSATLSANGGGLGAKTGLYKVGRDIGRRLVDGHRADADTSIPYERRIETREDDKCGTLTSVAKDNLVVGDRIRKLTPVECERLQGLPDNYTEGVATTHRYKCLGNAFNVDVVAHILGRVKLMYSRVANP
jgi:DNA (cytosine-5)-methyltransferase 3A